MSGLGRLPPPVEPGGKRTLDSGPAVEPVSIDQPLRTLLDYDKSGVAPKRSAVFVAKAEKCLTVVSECN